MSGNNNRTLVQTWIARLLKRRVIAAPVLIVIVLIGVGHATDALSKIESFARSIAKHGPAFSTNGDSNVHQAPPTQPSRRPSVISQLPVAVTQYYTPSGKMGDTGDITIAGTTEGGHRFTYVTNGRGPHEHDAKYVDNRLNLKAAQFAGVLYQAPPNNWGAVDGGCAFPKGIKQVHWEARSLRETVLVEFVMGGVNWNWAEGPNHTWQKITPPYPDSMPRVSFNTKALTTEWQTFSAILDQSNLDAFRWIVGGFGWVLSWGSNGVEPNSDETGPKTVKTFEIEIRNIHYE